MKEFVLLFRNNPNPETKPSPEQMQKMLENWMEWLGSIAAQNKLAERGHRLSMSEGKMLKAGNVTDGPFTELKEYISGFIIVRAAESAVRARVLPLL